MTIYAKTIQLKGVNPQEEAIANAAITPGHLVQIMTTGKIRVHATVGGNAEKIFAIEDELQGNGIDDAYASAAIVQYVAAQRGSWINAIIANDEVVAIGDALESKGDGTLRKHVAQIDSAADVEVIVADQIVGYAMQAVDMSGSSGVDPSGRCAIRVA